MLKPFSEMLKIDVSSRTEKRDAASYLPWAACKILLHDSGAEKVFFVPCVNKNGSSLFMSEAIFKDKYEVENRCYEVRVKITIDELEFEYQTPVMNGAAPVKDNSMSQQRVWNAQARAFVKGVAVYTGLGFSLWLKDEDTMVKEDDLSGHSIHAIKERVEQLITLKMQKKDISQKELCDLIDMNEKLFVNTMKAFDNIAELEKRLTAL